jgi:hypothetical protein
MPDNSPNNCIISTGAANQYIHYISADNTKKIWEMWLLVLPVCSSMTNGGTVPVPPLVMVVQTVYNTSKVHCNDAAKIKN